MYSLLSRHVQPNDQPYTQQSIAAKITLTRLWVIHSLEAASLINSPSEPHYSTGPNLVREYHGFHDNRIEYVRTQYVLHVNYTGDIRMLD